MAVPRCPAVRTARRDDPRFLRGGRRGADRRDGRSELARLERACLPTVGACAGQFTANTMAMVSEALGLAPLDVVDDPRPSTASAPASRRAPGHRHAGGAADGGPLPRDIVTRKALENACAIVAATGGSTNAALHIPAIAHEAGIAFDTRRRRRGLRAHAADRRSAPGRRLPRADVHEIGGMPMIIQALIEMRRNRRRTLTAHRRDAGAGLRRRARPGRGGGPRAGEPIAPTAASRCSRAISPRRRADQDRRAPDAACTKVRRACSKAKSDARAVDPARAYAAGDVLVIRNEGPVGGPGMQEMLGVTAADLRPGDGRAGRARHRRALLRRDARHLRRLCRARSGRRRPARTGARRRPRA